MDTHLSTRAETKKHVFFHTPDSPPRNTTTRGLSGMSFFRVSVTPRRSREHSVDHLAVNGSVARESRHPSVAR